MCVCVCQECVWLRFVRPPLHSSTASAAFLASLFPIILEESAVLRGHESRRETILLPQHSHFTWTCCGLGKVGRTFLGCFSLISPTKRKTTASGRSYKLPRASALQTHQRITAGAAKTNRPPHSHANGAQFALMLLRHSTKSRLSKQSVRVHDENNEPNSSSCVKPAKLLSPAAMNRKTISVVFWACVLQSLCTASKKAVCNPTTH